MPDFNKPQQVDPLRQKKNALMLEIQQNIKTLIRKLDGGSGEVQLEEEEEFELEGRDDVVVAVIEERDRDSGTSTINVVTSYDGEETSNDIDELSVDDALNVYEALKDLKR